MFSSVFFHCKGLLHRLCRIGYGVKSAIFPIVGRLRKLSHIGIALVLCLATMSAIFNLCVAAVSTDRVYVSSEAVPERYAAIVLGALVYPSGRPSYVLWDRLASALALYRQRKVKKILVTGDHGASRYDEVTAMYRWLRERDVAEPDIFMDHAGFRTYDSMARAAKVFDVEEAVICTQAFHLSRALFLADAFGIDAVGLVSDRRRYRHHYINHAREFFARTVAVLDAYVWYREPRFLGARIAISGDGRASH